MKKLSYAFVLALTTSIFFSCGGGNQGTEESDGETLAALESFVEEEFDYPIPTSYEVVNMLQKANANFVFNITNNPDNVANYETQWQKAMNLGVYGADLSYASTYNKSEETAQFLDASKI